MQKEDIIYQDEKQQFISSLYRPISRKTAPLVMVFPSWVGKDSFAEEKARYLASLGYLGFAVDMYGNAKIGSSPEENRSLMEPLMKDRLLLQKRAILALQQAKSIPGVSSIAAMGFCFGGLCVLDLARSGADIKGAVSIHGLLFPPPFSPGKITAKILALHGHDDPMVSPEEVFSFEKEMTLNKVDWQMHIFGHTMHAFTNPKAQDPGFGTVYEPTSCKRAFSILEGFLQEILHD